MHSNGPPVGGPRRYSWHLSFSAWLTLRGALRRLAIRDGKYRLPIGSHLDWRVGYLVNLELHHSASRFGIEIEATYVSGHARELPAPFLDSPCT
jgi:hypothetical protein